MKTELAIGEIGSHPFFFSKAKRRMIMIKKNYLVIIVAWLIAAGFIIIPGLILKQSVAVNTTLGDVVKAINSLPIIIFAAQGIGTGILLTVIALLYR